MKKLRRFKCAICGIKVVTRNGTRKKTCSHKCSVIYLRIPRYKKKRYGKKTIVLW